MPSRHPGDRLYLLREDAVGEIRYGISGILQGCCLWARHDIFAEHLKHDILADNVRAAAGLTNCSAEKRFCDCCRSGVYSKTQAELP